MRPRRQNAGSQSPYVIPNSNIYNNTTLVTGNMYPIIMISSPTALITMHNVKHYKNLHQSLISRHCRPPLTCHHDSFEPSQDARARAAAEGNTRPEDLIAKYSKRTHIDSSGKETETQARYFIVDSIEVLSKFGADAWDCVVCVMTTGQVWHVQVERADTASSSWCGRSIFFLDFFLGPDFTSSVYVTCANDPPYLNARAPLESVY
jgi:RNA pol II accessory factor, Cdc73 family, C-terminal